MLPRQGEDRPISSLGKSAAAKPRRDVGRARLMPTRRPGLRKERGRGRACAAPYTVKLSPHPHAPFALGLLNTNPAVKSSSTQSIVEPIR